MANAIVGSGKLLLLAMVVGVPIRIFGRRVSGGIRRQYFFLHHPLCH